MNDICYPIIVDYCDGLELLDKNQHFYRYNKTAAQILIKWSLQRGFICIPKSSKNERIAQNADIFDFTITQEDMATMVIIILYTSDILLLIFIYRTHGIEML